MNRRRAVQIASCIAASLCVALLLGADAAARYSYRYSPNPFCVPYGEPQTSSYDPYFDQPVDNGYVIDADAWGLNNADYNNDQICVVDANLTDAFAVSRPTKNYQIQ